MLWSLALVPALAAPALMLVPGSRAALGTAAGAVLGVTLALAIFAAWVGWESTYAWSDALALTSMLTPVSATVAVLVPAIALPIALYAASHEAQDGLSRLLALVLLFVGGMELLVIAGDFLTLLIGWEIVGACSWALIGHRYGEIEPPRAGIYAFVTTRLGDLGLFIAAFATYAGAGSFAFDAVPALSPTHLQIVAFGVLVSAAAKSGQVPFSPWLFRAMAGPTSVSALLHAATMVAAGAYLLARLGPALSQAEGFATAAIVIGLATALAGGIVAVLQVHAKKLLAASTSAQYGLMFAAVGAGWPGIALLHLVTHAGIKALLFLSAGVAKERAGSFSLDRMGLGRALPWTAGLALAGALALAGLPPLGASWTKEEIVAGVLDASVVAGALVMLAGGLSAAYAARFQTLAWFPAAEPSEGHAPGAGAIIGMAYLAALTLAASALWFTPVADAAASLVGARLPPSGTAEKVTSVILVLIGIAAGFQLARRKPGLGRGGLEYRASDWLGLPGLIGGAVVRPFDHAARLAAAVDDRILDALPRGIAAAARVVSRGLSTGDDRVVDRGVALVAALTEGVARLGDRIGELVAEGIPSGAGWLTGNGGRDLRLLQSGLSHHYYALLALGAAASVLLMLFLGP